MRLSIAGSSAPVGRSADRWCSTRSVNRLENEVRCGPLRPPFVWERVREMLEDSRRHASRPILRLRDPVPQTVVPWNSGRGAGGASQAPTGLRRIGGGGYRTVTMPQGSSSRPVGIVSIPGTASPLPLDWASTVSATPGVVNETKGLFVAGPKFLDVAPGGRCESPRKPGSLRALKGSAPMLARPMGRAPASSDFGGARFAARGSGAPSAQLQAKPRASNSVAGTT